MLEQMGRMGKQAGEGTTRRRRATWRRIGILISMAPDDLQDTILQHSDRLKEDKLVKDKMVGLLDARARLKDPNASDVDVAAIGKGRPLLLMRWSGPHSQRSGPTPKGKGKGKEDNGFNSKGSKGKGKSYSGKGFEKCKGKGMSVCGHCGKRGHDTSRCWTIHPDQLPWKSANVVEENHHYHGDRPDSNGHECLQFGA